MSLKSLGGSFTSKPLSMIFCTIPRRLIFLMAMPQIPFLASLTSSTVAENTSQVFSVGWSTTLSTMSPKRGRATSASPAAASWNSPATV